MQLTFLGATHEVTGSCNYLEVCGKRILIDYGMEQGKDFFVNMPIPVNPAELDAVLLTHAHIDHSGLLPLLSKNGFAGEVHATNGTCNLCRIMLLDSAHIQESEAEWRSRKAERRGEDPVEPLYDTADAQALIKQLCGHDYDERFTLFEGVEVRFADAGHLLGSSSVEIWLTEDGEQRKLVFSGDLGNTNQPLLNEPSMIDEADYVVVESTYGDRVHDAPPDYATAFADVLQKTFDRGGSVIIPSFAVGRTQELLYFIRHIKAEGLVRGHDGFTVYVDSPLANAATKVFVENAEECYDPEALSFLNQGINPLEFPGLTITETVEDSKAINFDKRPKVIISASGMCEAGRIRHHLKHGLWSPKNTVVFVGFQAIGTVGRALIEGAKHVKLFGEEVAVGAKVVELPGISAHGDSIMLTNWVRHYSPAPKMVFVNHGESDVCDTFAEKLTEECGIPASAPYSGARFDLINCVYVKEAAPVPLEKGEKAAPAEPRPDSPFGKLLSALERLTKLIKKGAGRSNSELRSVAQQLDDIADEWESFVETDEETK